MRVAAPRGAARDAHAQVRDGKTMLPCIVGVPLPGERLEAERFDACARRPSSRRPSGRSGGCALAVGAIQRNVPALSARLRPGRQAGRSRRRRTSASTARSTS